MSCPCCNPQKVFWEYKARPAILLFDPAGDEASAESHLDNYGYEGWELVTVYRGMAIFKRPRQPITIG